MAQASTNNTADREIVISRIINAPRELVFEVWTDPKHIENWWGPNGFTSKVHEMNVVPGGTWKLTMDGMGMSFPNEIKFLEVVKPERLVYTHGSGEENNPRAFHVTITFDKQGGKTLLTMRSLFGSAEVRTTVVNEFKVIDGGNQTVDRFEAQLAEIIAARSLSISRILNAPRELVFEVWTNPEHIKNWWGPNGFTNTISNMDLTPSGEWEFVMHGPDGTDYKNKNRYIEVVHPERIVMDHVTAPRHQVTATFEDMGDQTKLNMVMTFESEEEKANTIAVFKADEGMIQNVDKLETYLATPAMPITPAKEVIITRIFNAPPELMYQLWTDAKHLEKWWGPKGFTAPLVDLETYPGGNMRIDMQGPDGTIYPGAGKYIELKETELIVFMIYVKDNDGKLLFETMNRITFAKEGDSKTLITVTATARKIRPEGLPYIGGMNEGWKQTLDKLDNYTNNI